MSYSPTEANFTGPTEDCPHPELWHAPDEQATEVEVTALIAAFIRALHPDYVVETGSYHGDTTVAIAQALHENGHGELVSLEFDRARFRMAQAATHGFDNVELVNMDSLAWTPERPIDFAWLDSGSGETRYGEFKRYYPWFHRATIVGLHDTAPHHKDVAAAVIKLDLEDVFRYINLPTPRGVAFGNILGAPKRDR